MVTYHNLFLFLDQFHVLLDVLDVLLEGRGGAEHALTGLQLLQPLVGIFYLLTFSQLQVLPGGEKERERL